MEPIPFHVPSIEEEDLPGVLEALRAGWLTTGPKCFAFEEAFAAYLGATGDDPLHCLAVNSATSGMHLALEAAGVGEGDRVLTTPYTFTATSEVVRYLGADPVFVDVDEHDFNLRPEAVAAAADALPTAERERVKAVLPVHFAGLGCDMEGFQRLCEARGWKLVDDAAHALPTRVGGAVVGTVGDASAFSFYATKTLCTGEGGMVVTRDADMAARMRTMRLHGISRDAFDRYRSEKPSWYYEVVAPGYKYNMTDLAAALGLSQLKRVDAFREARARIAARYGDGLSSVEGLRTPPDAPDAPGGDLHAWHLYALRVEGDRELRDRFIEVLAEEQIRTSVHFIPLHLQPYWRDRFGLRPEDFPVATRLFSQEVSLPIYPSMTDAQVDRVVETIPRALERARKRVKETA